MAEWFYIKWSGPNDRMFAERRRPDGTVKRIGPENVIEKYVGNGTGGGCFSLLVLLVSWISITVTYVFLT